MYNSPDVQPNNRTSSDSVHPWADCYVVPRSTAPGRIALKRYTSRSSGQPITLVEKRISRQEAHGEIRVLSHQAGSVVKNEKFPVHFLQIWALPWKRSLPPNYHTQTFSEEANRYGFVTIISPLRKRQSLFSRIRSPSMPTWRGHRCGGECLQVESGRRARGCPGEVWEKGLCAFPYDQGGKGENPGGWEGRLGGR